MSIIKLLDLFGVDEPENQEEVANSRREAFRAMGRYGKKLSMAALPAGLLGSLPRTAFAQEAPDPLSILNYALTLEHLEYRFYELGMDTAGLIPTEDRPVFAQIRKHEEAHVSFLQATISAFGGTPVAEPDFDFTAGGTFPDPHDPANYAIFLALAQGFEDTGVRAYKGQAVALQGAALSATRNTALTAALSIHGVEARHAAQVRRMREQKGWIPQAQAIEGFEAATAPIYAGEDNVMQGGVDVTTLTPDFGIDAVTAAYDEPLTMEAVAGANGIAAAFIVG